MKKVSIVLPAYNERQRVAELYQRMKAVLELLDVRDEPSSPRSAEFDLVELPVIDPLLYYSVQSERHLLKYWPLPLGASVIILAQKWGNASG